MQAVSSIVKRRRGVIEGFERLACVAVSFVIGCESCERSAVGDALDYLTTKPASWTL